LCLSRLHEKERFMGLDIKNKLRESLNEYEEYAVGHQAPGPGGVDSPLYDVTNTYGEDFYSEKGWYYYGDHADTNADKYCWALISRYRNKPNSLIKIYRAVPDFNRDVKNKIKPLQEFLSYYNKWHFYPNNSKIYDKYSAKYYEEGKGYLFDDYNERIYRDVQEDITKLETELIKGIKINNGDWVTIYRDYAKEHGISNLNNKYKILTKTVRARQLYTEGSIYEWGYWEKE